MKVFRWLENVVLRLGFVNTLFHARAMLLIFEAEIQSSEDSTLVNLKEMPSNARVYNSCICHTRLFSLVDDLLFNKIAHLLFDFTRFAENE